MMFRSKVGGAGGRVQRLPAPHHHPRDWRSRGSWLSRSLARARADRAARSSRPASLNIATRSTARMLAPGASTTPATASDYERQIICAAAWLGSPDGQRLGHAVSAAPRSRRRWIRAPFVRHGVAIEPCRFATKREKTPGVGASPRHADSDGCARASVWCATSSLLPAGLRAAVARSDASFAIGQTGIQTSRGRASSCDARKNAACPTNTLVRAWCSSAMPGRVNSVTDRRRNSSSRRDLPGDQRSTTLCRSRRVARISIATFSARACHAI